MLIQEAKKKTIILSGRTSNRSLAQIARRHPDKPIGKQAARMLAARKAAKAKQPKISHALSHLRDLAKGKKKNADPTMVKVLKKASKRSIVSTFNTATKELEAERPVKKIQRKANKLQRKLDSKSKSYQDTYTDMEHDVNHIYANALALMTPEQRKEFKSRLRGLLKHYNEAER